jgi:hypothetical protein
MNSPDEPLLVLKYQRYKVVLRIVLYSVLALICGIAVFVVPATFSNRVFGVLLAIVAHGFPFMAFIFLIIDMLLFKEVRLYRDRIVRVRRSLGEREIKLARAWLMSFKYPLSSFKYIVDQDAKRFLDKFKEVVYDEYLADWKEVEKLNSLMADLTGRRVEDFQKAGVTTLGRLIT